MTLRSDLKQQSRDKILHAAGRRMRREGLEGAGIAAVMADAGLTHGAFYAHFKNKGEMLRAALERALDGNRKRWVGHPKQESWAARLARLARRYLTPSHRRELESSCALAALCSEAGRGDDAFKQRYEQELIKSLSALCGDDFHRAAKPQQDEALAFMSLMIGALTLSRAVASEQLSDRLLKAGQQAAGRLSEPA